MPHSTQASADSTSIYSEGYQKRPMTSTSTYNHAGTGLVGTALTKRDSRTDLPSVTSNANSWKRNSSPIADAYADLVGKGGNIDEVLAGRQAGDRTSMGQYNNASKHRTQYYEDQFRYKDSDVGTVKERVQRESPVIAELRTNVIIKDEFTLVTDLSYHLAQRYTRPDSSIMIKVDHSACLALGGTFDPCYILTITALPSQLGPTLNKRNAALIQSFMADILSVPSDRGIVKFQPIEECNYAMNGTTMLGQIEKLEKHQDEHGPGAVKRAITNASRKTTVPSNSNRKSMTKQDTDVKALNGAPTPNGVTPTTNGTTPVERKRRSTSATPPPASAIPNVFELPAIEALDRPSTSHGAYAAENGLRMNGISKEDLVGAAAKTPTGRPKTIAGQSPHRSVQDQIKNEPMPKAQRQSSHGAPSKRNSVSNRTQPKPGAIPISPKPERPVSHAGPQAKPASESRPAATTPAKEKDTYLDGVTTTTAKPKTERQQTSEKIDPKIDARAAEKNRESQSRDTAANTAKRRSTVTATPKIPPPPPVPQERSREPKVGKRKSFLSAFRRSTAG